MKKYIKWGMVFITGLTIGANYHQEIHSIMQKIETTEYGKYLKVLKLFK